MNLYPLLIQPALHTRVWGGRRLASLLNKTLPSDEPYGEAWELHDSTTVLNGKLAGQTIGALVGEYGAALIGAGNDPAEGFPLLVKFLDANQFLSVQVHPNDEQAHVLEGDPRGKTEAWVILAAEPQAQLVIGVQEGTTREEMAAAIRENRLESLLVYAKVGVGDVLYLAANTVHALGDGLVIYEIQQSSDITYRLYDWGRVGLDGQPRQLHIEKGVQVSNINSLPLLTHPDEEGSITTLIAGDYFKTLRYSLTDETLEVETSGKFHALTCIAGQVQVESAGESVTMNLGQTVLIPASLPAYTLQGTGKILNSFQS